jgi:ABC-type amino acid transport substrate-binding protein
MKKILFYLVCTSIIFAGCYLHLQNPSTKTIRNDLIIGISPDYPPYAQIDLQTGAIVGLEVDIVTEIASRLHKNLIIKDMPFNSLIIELIAGQIDAIAAGLTPTPARKKNILFSHAYINDDENLVISKKNLPAIHSIQDLYGKQIAVNIGYTADSYLSKYPEMNLVRLKSPSDGFVALQSDSVDAFVVARSIFENFAKNHPTQDVYQTFTLPSSADACALAFAKYSHELQAQIDPVIDAMIADGTMLTIQKKWGFA